MQSKQIDFLFTDAEQQQQKQQVFIERCDGGEWVRAATTAETI